MQQEKDELQAKIDALQQQLEEANEHGEKSIQVNNKKDAQNQELLVPPPLIGFFFQSLIVSP